eukprot:SAG11_NODE_21432_length_425_cov_0.785276_1_plen_46_part_00
MESYIAREQKKFPDVAPPPRYAATEWLVRGSDMLTAIIALLHFGS